MAVFLVIPWIKYNQNWNTFYLIRHCKLFNISQLLYLRQTSVTFLMNLQINYVSINLRETLEKLIGNQLITLALCNRGSFLGKGRVLCTFVLLMKSQFSPQIISSRVEPSFSFVIVICLTAKFDEMNMRIKFITVSHENILFYFALL